ncbi:uncharacterized protein LOC113519443 [Galleria mellonella]|uniref:Uncharacterized protein LOC113519443 n=1 Tax=Galleria mellonella TaxID=7137 RepID=A0A6J1WVV6_GALME|nr:uncharacterized protein LOC113519443 [Galleria mellonella]
MVDIKLQDIQKKICIIQRIIEKCENGGVDDQPASSRSDSSSSIALYYKAAQYTGESVSILKNANSFPRYKDICDKIKENETKRTSAINCSIIHQLMVEYYITKRIPIQKRHVPEQFGNSDDLKKIGYKWHDIPGTDKCIFIEDPEQQAKRMYYLINMKKFREENRPIIYVTHKVLEESAFNNKDRVQHHVLIAASLLIGIIDCSVVSVANLNIAEWIQSMVVPHLTESYVLVIGSEFQKVDAAYLAVPKPGDNTATMKSWLEKNRISFNSSMCRAELYELIERHNHAVFPSEDIYKQDEILKANGVEVLRRPNWDKLDYFQFFWKDFIKYRTTFHKCNFEKGIKEFIKSYKLDVWQQFNQIVAQIEQSIYEEDMLLEEVIDKLLSQAIYHKLDSDLEFSSRAEVKTFDPYEYDFIM